MGELRRSIRKNRVKIILAGLIIGNLMLFQLSDTLFTLNKKANTKEQPKPENEQSFYQRGIHILHIGNVVVDYLRYFGEQKDH